MFFVCLQEIDPRGQVYHAPAWSITSRSWFSDCSGATSSHVRSRIVKVYSSENDSHHLIERRDTFASINCFLADGGGIQGLGFLIECSAAASPPLHAAPGENLIYATGRWRHPGVVPFLEAPSRSPCFILVRLHFFTVTCVPWRSTTTSKGLS